MHSLITPFTTPRARRFGLAALAVAASVALMPSTADAQSRQRGGPARGRAVYRSAYRGPTRVVTPRPYYGYRSYRPATNFGFFYGYPGYFGGYRNGFGGPFGYYNGLYSGYYGGAWGNGWAAPYGYGYVGYSGRPYGGVRIDLPQRNAEVYVDGYFVGTVDDFDGRMQQANLEAGPHHVEVRDPDFDDLSFDVNVEPGRTVTYRGTLRPLRP